MELVSSQLRQRLGQIASHCFLVHGAETLLVEETRSLLRQHFASQGFSDVNRLCVETGFDWSSLEHSTRSLSLFAERRYIELRLPTGKPGDGGTAFIEHFARDPGDDTVLVVVCGKLDKKALASGWCRSVAQHGVIIDAGSVQAARLPDWIRQRFAELGVNCATDVAARLAYYVEGNLLAADQEVRKLALILPSGATLDEERLVSVMADHARFSVFAFVDACICGQAERSLRILRSLRQEGTEPVVMVWALARETRTLNLLAADLKSGQARNDALRRQGVWSSRAPMVLSALKRLGISRLCAIQAGIARLDRLAKGHEHAVCGSDNIWREIERAALGICGINPFPRTEPRTRQT